MKKAKAKPKGPKAQWMAIEEVQLEGGDSEVRSIDNIPFRMLGELEGQIVVVVPPRVTSTQGQRLLALVEKNTGRRPMLFTDDVRFAKLRKLTDVEAAARMQKKVIEKLTGGVKA